MKTRVSISAKILFLALWNTALLALVFVIFARTEYRSDLTALLLSPGPDSVVPTSVLIAHRLSETDPAQWNHLLAQYTASTGASAFLFTSQGVQLAGAPVSLPAAVLERIHRWAAFQSGATDARTTDEPEVSGARRPPGSPVFVIRAGNPACYWVGFPAAMVIFTPSKGGSEPSALLWMSPHFWSNPFFFDYRPWLSVMAAVLLVSALCWLPFIRGLTLSIFKLKGATAAIAEGRFDTRLPVNRRDELGQLSESVNRMAERLLGFVNGQKRFLGDIAHELCSPIARIQVALGILDQRAPSDQQEYVNGLRDEVEHMSSLIGELLLFSKAGMSSSATPLTGVNVSATVERVLEREASSDVAIETHIDKGLEVMAHSDLLFRALANVVRNAIRYAGDAGPIEVSANATFDAASVVVADNGPGIPPAELEEVFKPFYRPDSARQRETGGIGLGLAIVRSCVQACGGTVACRNRSPKGLAIEIKLQVAHKQPS